MSGFSANWLALREPLDFRARNGAVRDAFLAALPACRPLRLLDLGSGTGASWRALAPAIDGAQHWILTDNDPVLLGFAGEAAAGQSGLEVDPVELDLAASLPPELLDNADAVTTSAFLDLASAAWIRRLVGSLTRRQLPFLAALTYDGRAELEPEDPFDASIRAAVNRHQRGDKGLGPALGPGAAEFAAAAFESAGYRVIRGLSDWVTRSEENAFCLELIGGWAAVAVETGLMRTQVGDWLARRQALAEAGMLTIKVGHVDLAAVPK